MKKEAALFQMQEARLMISALIGDAVVFNLISSES